MKASTSETWGTHTFHPSTWPDKKSWKLKYKVEAIQREVGLTNAVNHYWTNELNLWMPNNPGSTLKHGLICSISDRICYLLNLNKYDNQSTVLFSLYIHSWLLKENKSYTKLIFCLECKDSIVLSWCVRRTHGEMVFLTVGSITAWLSQCCIMW